MDGARGWADIEAHKPITPDTPFNIASLTKPMTSVMLMQLVERGQLSLGTPMQRYDPSYKDARVRTTPTSTSCRASERGLRRTRS